MGAGKQDRSPTGRPRAEGGRNWRTSEQQGGGGRGSSARRLRGELRGPGAPEGPEGGGRGRQTGPHTLLVRASCSQRAREAGGMGSGNPVTRSGCSFKVISATATT